MLVFLNSVVNFAVPVPFKMLLTQFSISISVVISGYFLFFFSRETPTYRRFSSNTNRHCNVAVFWEHLKHITQLYIPTYIRNHSASRLSFNCIFPPQISVAPSACFWREYFLFVIFSCRIFRFSAAIVVEYFDVYFRFVYFGCCCLILAAMNVMETI